MARSLSARALACVMSGPSIVTKVTVTKPGGDPIEVVTAPGWSAQEVGPVAGTRGTISSIQFLPTAGVDDLFELINWAGATFDAFIGINLGTAVEYVQVFHGMVVDNTARRTSEGVTASLSDPWFYYDKIKLFHAFKTVAGDSRAADIGELFTMLDLGVSVIVTDDGGTVVRPAVYTDSRGQAASDLAGDGLLQAGFDGDGDLVIKAQPDLDALTPVWTFRSGTSGPYPEGALPTEYPTIVAGSLERGTTVTDSKYNSVKVSPAADWQTWKPQTINLKDTSDPRHQNNIGLRRLQVKSNTIDNACDALTLAKNTLTRLLRGSDEHVRVTVSINPAVEADDVIYLAAMPTLDDPKGWAGAYIVTSVTHDPTAGTTAIEAITAAAYAIGQVA